MTRFDTDKDYVQIKYDSPAAKVKFGVKMFGTSASTMTVQGSADGTAFSDVEAFTIPKTQNKTYSFTTSKSIDASYRYIRLSFTKGGNVGLGAVEITKESTDPVIFADNIIGVSARGLENQTLVYSISNEVDGAVLSVTGDNEVVTAIDIDGVVTYDVAANKTASDREGTITLTYAKDGVTLTEKTVKVQQLAPVFKVSRASVEIDATKGAQTTITVTSDFDWMADASTSARFSFSPNTYAWQEGGKETVTITASADNSSESGTATLGTITFSNIETKEEIIVTVAQKSSYVAPTTGKTVTKKISDIVSENNYKVSSGNNNINTIMKSLKIDDLITMSSTGGGNTGSFWGTSPNIDWRCYQNGNSSVVKISAADGYVIEKVKLIFTVSNSGTLNGGEVVSGKEYIVNAQDISYTIGHSSGTKNGQIRITEISVTYKGK